MSTRLAPLVARQYRSRLQALRDAITAQARRLYGELDPDAIDASFEAIAPRIALYLESGKGSAAALSAAFVAQVAALDAGVPVEVPQPPADVAKSGLPLAQGLRDYVVPAVLGAIGAGTAVPDAIGYGDYLLAQFADSEVLRSADETVRAARESRHYAGWEGEVSAGACANCIAENSGRHGPDDALYRHGNCGCAEIPIFEAAS